MIRSHQIPGTNLLSVVYSRRFGSYRAHYGDAVYAYDHGRWGKTASRAYESLDFDSASLVADEGVCHALHVDEPPGRNFRDVARRVFDIPSSASTEERIGRFGETGPSTPSRGTDAANLCVCIVKGLTDPGRDRVGSANFSRRASVGPPGGRGSVDFENTYASISSLSESEPFACERAPKYPSRNCYAFAPSSLSYRHRCLEAKDD